MGWMASSSNLGPMSETRFIPDEYDLSSEASEETPRRSSALPFSPTMIIDGIFSRKSFLYNKLPSEPLRLSVLKLDGSRFDIEVTKSATIAELKQAVEAVFSHMPQKGPGKISWPHVWGQFCLSHAGQKLVLETDYLRNYGIRDGDQLQFIRHVSNSYNLRKRRSKKKGISLRRYRSLSQVINYEHKKYDGDDDDDGIGLDGIVIENGKIQRIGNNGKSLTGILGGLFAYTRLAVVRRTRAEGRVSPSRVASSLLGSFRKIRRIISLCRKRQFLGRLTWGQR